MADQENEELDSLGEGGLYSKVDASSEGGPDERGGRSIQHTMSGTMTMGGARPAPPRDSGEHQRHRWPVITQAFF